MRFHRENVEAVAGVEITSEYCGKEVHVLGLFLQPQCFDRVAGYVGQIQQFKRESNLRLEKNLQASGIPVDYGEIAENAKGSVNRVHFAKEMVRLGYAASVSEAFENYLNEGKGYYIPAKRLNALDTVTFLHSVRALPVLAHPFLNLTEIELRDFLPEAKARGLAGMETDYSLFTAEQTNEARAIAEQYGLLKSGGSDFHGHNKPDIAMGTGRGTPAVPADYFTAMRDYMHGAKTRTAISNRGEALLREAGL